MEKTVRRILGMVMAALLFWGVFPATDGSFGTIKAHAAGERAASKLLFSYYDTEKAKDDPANQQREIGLLDYTITTKKGDVIDRFVDTVYYKEPVVYSGVCYAREGGTKIKTYNYMLRFSGKKTGTYVCELFCPTQISAVKDFGGIASAQGTTTVKSCTSIGSVLVLELEVKEGKDLTTTMTDTYCSFYVDVLEGKDDEDSSDGKNAQSDIATQIATAPAGGMIRLDGSEDFNSLSNNVMQALVRRGDVTLEFIYRYKDVDYKIVIPAGMAVNDNTDWYGPLNLAGRYGNRWA